MSGRTPPHPFPSADASAAPSTELPPATTTWLAAHGWDAAGAAPLAGDVSSRRYLRLTRTGAPGGEHRTALLVLHPPKLRSACRRFLRTTDLLRDADVRVPRVLAADCDGGHMLVEDLGAETLDLWAARRLEEGGWRRVAPCLRAAVDAARRIAGLDPAQVAPLSPPLDRTLLARELDLAAEHFLAPRGLLGNGGAERRSRRALESLAEAGAEPAPVPCHRDFMVRNLLPMPPGEGHAGAEEECRVAVIDHQDLRLGPPLYDLASLLNDTLFPPAALEEEVLAAWGVIGDDRSEYHRVAAQRTLKAVGSYAMAAARGNRRRLELIPATLERSLRHLAQVPELAGWGGELARRWRGR